MASLLVLCSLICELCTSTLSFVSFVRSMVSQVSWLGRCYCFDSSDSSDWETGPWLHLGTSLCGCQVRNIATLVWYLKTCVNSANPNSRNSILREAGSYGNGAYMMTILQYLCGRRLCRVAMVVGNQGNTKSFSHMADCR